MTSAKVISVNVGRPRAFEHSGKPAESAIWKSPVAGSPRPGELALTFASSVKASSAPAMKSEFYQRPRTV